MVAVWTEIVVIVDAETVTVDVAKINTVLHVLDD